MGRKTASVVLNELRIEPAIAVDTHVFRVAHRLGLATGKTPDQVEAELMALVPEPLLTRAHHWLILHGRYVCVARRPKCEECVVADLCPSRHLFVKDRPMTPAPPRPAARPVRPPVVSLAPARSAARVLDAVPAPDRELMVPVRGGRIYVRVNGRLDGPKAPLVMVHGGPGSSHAGFIPALPLADDRAVILYDQLDNGRSDAPNDPFNWTVERFVSEIDAIRAALNLRQFHLLGQSWGGTVVNEYAARRPAGLKSLILSSPLISTSGWEVSTSRRA